MDVEETDYLIHALQEPENVRFFSRYATRPEWLRWANDKLESFREIFTPNPQLNEISQQYAYWFSERFVCEYSEDALAILQRNNQTISPFLWNVLSTRIAFHKPRPSPEEFSTCVSILLQAVRYQDDPNLLGYLLTSCRFP